MRDINETVRIHRLQHVPILDRISDPFAVIEQPTAADLAEYLRHSNAPYANDAIRERAQKVQA